MGEHGIVDRLGTPEIDANAWIAPSLSSLHRSGT